MQIHINGKEVDITIRRSRRSRRLRLAVHPGGLVTMTAPYLMTDIRLEPLARKFVLEKGDWLLHTVDKMKKFALVLPKRSAGEVRKEYLSLKENAKKLVTKRLEYFNQYYGFKIGNITIRNQKSRWGSCSRKGNLNFNYRIAVIPLELLDYIVVHELCHIGEMNHSKKFWDLVLKTIPDCKERRKKLKGNLF
ncbi:MAG: M48 family metallopeptidase [Patescibacteria group bacterium]